MGEWLGLEEDEHLLCWSDHDELKWQIWWALHHEQERREIARRGQHFIHRHHSFEARVRELEVIIDGRWRGNG